MSKGDLVVAPTPFDSIGDFVNGLAPAIVDFKINKFGYINKKGEFKIAPQFEPATTFSEGLAAVQIGVAHIAERWGYINTSGELVIPARFADAKSFAEGLAVVEILGKVGCINTTGEVVIPAIFDRASCFSEGLAVIEILGKVGYIDTTGKVVIPGRFSDARSFSEGRAAVKISGKWGFIDTAGDLVIPARFEHVQRFSEGLAAVSDNPNIHGDVQEHHKDKPESERRHPLRWESYDSRWGFIDQNGHIKIPLTYWIADDFLDGIAALKCGVWEPYETFGFINTEGKFVIDLSLGNSYSRQRSRKWSVEDSDGVEYAAYEGVTVQEFIRVANDLQKYGKAKDNMGNNWKITRGFYSAKGHRSKYILMYDPAGDQE
jgi:serine/threonine-protein kinase